MFNKQRFCMFLVILFISMLLYSKPHMIVTLATDDKSDFPVKIFKDKVIDSKKPGVVIEMLQLVEKDLKIKFRFLPRPWTRCQAELKSNMVDGIFTASFKTSRMEIGRYPMKGNKVDPNKRIMSNSYSFYKLKSNAVEWNGKKFANLNTSIGAVRGNSVIKTLEKKKLKLDKTTSPTLNLNKLIAGRFDVIAAGEYNTDMLIRKSKKYRDIVKLKPPFVTKPYYVMLSHKFVKNNPKLAEKIWDSIERIRKSEKMLQIYDTYFKK